MKTAQELINNWKFDKRKPILLTEDEVIDLMKEYARQACMEQRNICSRQDDYVSFHDLPEFDYREKIQNAPEPDLK